MSPLTDAERSLVLSHLAALSHHGMPLGESIPLIAPHMPRAAARRNMEGVSALLQRGESLGGEDPLFVLLVRAEIAGGAALTDAARAFELMSAATQFARTGFRQALLMSACLWALIALAAWVLFPSLISLPESTPPRFTILAYAIAKALTVLVAAAMVLAVILRERVLGRVPGVAGYRNAAQLRLCAAGLATGSPDATTLSPAETRLDPYEALMFQHALQAPAPVDAVRSLAADVEQAARTEFEDFRAKAKPLAFGVLVASVLIILVALYLPLFQLTAVLR